MNNQNGAIRTPQALIIFVFCLSAAFYFVIKGGNSILGLFITFGIALAAALILLIIHVFGYNMVKRGRSFDDCIKALPELFKWMFSAKTRKIDNQMAEIFKIYSQECDPEKFILKASEYIATSIPITYEFVGRWNIANAYYELGDTEKAIEIAENLISLYDNNKAVQKVAKKVQLYDILVYFYLEAKKFEKAKLYMDLRDEEMQHLSAAERKELEDALFPFSQGLQLFSEGRYDEALAYREKTYARVKQLGTTNLSEAQNHYHFAKIYHKLGDLEKEIEHLQLVMKFGSKGAVGFTDSSSPEQDETRMKLSELKMVTEARHRLQALGVEIAEAEGAKDEEVAEEQVLPSQKRSALGAYLVLLIMAIGLFIWLSNR